MNLLDNAIKYSVEGSAIQLKICRIGGSVKVQISNIGAGIPKEEIPRIFERFYRVRSQGDRSIRGTGLGLAISKSIIEAHGGRIWVESFPQQPTVFAFTIPMNFEPKKRVPLKSISPEGSHHE